MLISLDELKPSPWNPKEPFTKREFAALKECVNEFGFQRSLCVCKDFQTGEGFFVLDGNTALDLLKELRKKKIDCHIVEKVTDEKTLEQFMAGYAIHKKPLYSEFALKLGKADFQKFTGLDYSKFSFNVQIDKIKLNTGSIPGPTAAGSVSGEKNDAQAGTGASADERQSQYFLTLPPDCVEKLKNFVKTKAYKTSKTEAIAEKIDAMNDKQFLENILQIVL